MKNDKPSILKGWLASVNLSELELRALAQVPEAILAEYCDEVLGFSIPHGLSSWYTQKDIKSWGGLCPVGNSGYSRLAAHQLMLSDEVRLETFNRAISHAIHKGDVVVDVGTGTGILSLMACRAGADRVYAIERDEVAALAAEIIDFNGFTAIATVIAADASNVDLSEPADVLISECIGSGGVGTTQIAAVLESRKRLLRPGGIMIPQELTVVVAPVESILTELYLRFWESKPNGFDFDPAYAWARDQMYTVIILPEQLLASPSDVFKLKYDINEYKGFNTEVECCINRSGTIHGLGVWFRTVLIEGVSLDTAPGQPLTHWYQCFLPLRKGVDVQASDKISILIGHRYEEEKSVWDWKVQIGDTFHPTTPQTTDSISRKFAQNQLTLSKGLTELEEIILHKTNANPSKSYTRRLLDGGIDLYGAKVIEEAYELVQAANSEGKIRTIEECADLVYHMMVLLRRQNIGIVEIMEELKKRRR